MRSPRRRNPNVSVLNFLSLFLHRGNQISIMNSDYVQTASQRTTPEGFRKTDFVNTSSQQMTPGSLPTFFRHNNPSGYMPFPLANLRVPQAPIVDQMSESKNVSRLPKANTMPKYFEDNTKSQLERFRTSSMRAWDVPLGLTELRATDTTF